MAKNLEQDFRKFHAENPEVYDELKSLAVKLLAAGYRFYGIKALFEVIRFHRALKNSDREFKLNNNYTAFYARMLMQKEPVLAGFFKIRKQRNTEGRNAE